MDYQDWRNTHVFNLDRCNSLQICPRGGRLRKYNQDDFPLYLHEKQTTFWYKQTHNALMVDNPIMRNIEIAIIRNMRLKMVSFATNIRKDDMILDIFAI